MRVANRHAHEGFTDVNDAQQAVALFFCRAAVCTVSAAAEKAAESNRAPDC